MEKTEDEMVRIIDLWSSKQQWSFIGLLYATLGLIFYVIVEEPSADSIVPGVILMGIAWVITLLSVHYLLGYRGLEVDAIENTDGSFSGNTRYVYALPFCRSFYSVFLLSVGAVLLARMGGDYRYRLDSGRC